MRAAELEHEPACVEVIERTHRSVVWCGCQVVKSRDKYLCRGGTKHVGSEGSALDAHPSITRWKWTPL